MNDRTGTTAGPAQGPEAGPEHGPEPIEARFTNATPAEVERAIEATAARYVADFAGLYERISAEIAERYEQTIAAKDETIAELRRRAEIAEAERDALRAQAAPRPPSEAPMVLAMKRDAAARAR